MPTVRVTDGKAWIEMVTVTCHRSGCSDHLACGDDVGRETPCTWYCHLLERLVLTFVRACVQGAFGALTVTMKLFPLIVTLHLLGVWAC